MDDETMNPTPATEPVAENELEDELEAEAAELTARDALPETITIRLLRPGSSDTNCTVPYGTNLGMFVRDQGLGTSHVTVMGNNMPASYVLQDNQVVCAVAAKDVAGAIYQATLERELKTCFAALNPGYDR